MLLETSSPEKHECRRGGGEVFFKTATTNIDQCPERREKEGLGSLPMTWSLHQDTAAHQFFGVPLYAGFVKQRAAIHGA